MIDGTAAAGSADGDGVSGRVRDGARSDGAMGGGGNELRRVVAERAATTTGFMCTGHTGSSAGWGIPQSWHRMKRWAIGFAARSIDPAGAYRGSSPCRESAARTSASRDRGTDTRVGIPPATRSIARKSRPESKAAASVTFCESVNTETFARC